MAQDKKQVEQITDMEVDFAKWFTDVCKKAELIDYSSIKGVFIYRPYGYAIWENFQKILDEKFKETGHENVYLPLLIPESLLQKEKDHVEGFAPECAWVTMGGSEKLEERYCIRPTSETLFCEHYKNIIHSHRDLPKLYNQWCSVLRWEKTSRPFLRHREFLWQEGHTMHATAEEAIAETEQMFNIYADFCENYLAMPVVKGRKTDKEKFSGAEATYTVECMMHDKKALQAGTSHYFGDGFATAFDITFTGEDNKPHHPFQTSWGVSTRLIGGIIMTHGDNNGLVLPPRIAPIQVIIIPVAQHKPGVIEANQAVICRTLGDHPQVALVVGDGLSSAAIEANALDCLEAIKGGLKAYGLEAGPALFVKFCRVGASDHIGDLTGAEVVCMLVGERPGLVTAESMSAYLTYKPHIGIPESKRTVISNIHKGGTTAVEAGAHIAELIKTMLERKASGIDLR